MKLQLISLAVEVGLTCCSLFFRFVLLAASGLCKILSRVLESEIAESGSEVATLSGV